MNEIYRRISLSCAVLILSACLFISLLSISTAAVVLVNQIYGTATETQAPAVISPSLGGSTQTPSTDSTQNDSSSPPVTTTPDGTNAGENRVDSLPQDILDQMALIEQQVIELRGLPAAEDITRILYSPEELRQVVMDDFFGDYTAEEALVDAIVLWIFGLVERDADLQDIYIDLYSEGIAGFYDEETGEMAVVVGQGFGGAEHITYAHEYTHALQDQTYDLSEGLGYNEEACEQDSERCAAISALLEGDATQTEFVWLFDYATPEQYRQLQEFIETYASPAYDNSPPFLQADLLFPYSYGQEFVRDLYEQGGWDAVDAAYSDLPVSTEQILHPERYPQDAPIPVSLPDLTTVLGPDWELMDEDVLGEWYTFLVLARGIDDSAQLSDFEAGNAAEGWGGDAYAVYQRGQDEAVVMLLNNIWDTTEDATEFVEAFERYATGRFGSPLDQSPGEISWSSAEGYTLLRYEGDQTFWIFAPDEFIVDAIWDEFQNP
ncbi:MAG: hypothetical protein FVQ83_08305 [Chloroflexi bacterium]|nr:hypothetical protein [Chloroflexota bacterium]